MKIAYTMAPGKGETDLLLHAVADFVAKQGFECCGAVQVDTARSQGYCDMDLQLLPEGPRLRISQDLGAASKGCRLDPAALETAVSYVESALHGQVDILIINKFGKHEAEGRGFRSAIAKAVDLDIPIVVGVNALNFDAFSEFAGTQAVQLKPTVDAIWDWLSSYLGDTGARRVSHSLETSA